MTDKEQKILNDSLSKLFKIDLETLASLYNEAGELVNFSKILELDAERIKKYKTESDSQFKRGVKETMVEFEEELKEKYELDSELKLKGVDLIDHLVVKKIEEVKSAGTKDISKHPEMTKARLEWEKEQKKRDEEWQKKIDAKDIEFAQVKLKENVKSRGLAYLDEFKPVLNPDPAKANQWRGVYINELLSYKYQSQDGEDPVALGDDGQPLKDSHGYVRKLKDLSKEVADKYFDYIKAEERNSPGLKEQHGTGGDGFRPPKDEVELMTRLQDSKITPKERIQLTEFGNVNFK
jgi:hypothetical protein